VHTNLHNIWNLNNCELGSDTTGLEEKRKSSSRGGLRHLLVRVLVVVAEGSGTRDVGAVDSIVAIPALEGLMTQEWIYDTADCAIAKIRILRKSIDTMRRLRM